MVSSFAAVKKQLPFLRHGLRLMPICVLVTALLFPHPAQACYGPKLYVGVGSDSLDSVFYELVSLYVREKTGVETVRVELKGKSPLDALEDEEVDLVPVETPAAGFDVLIGVGDLIYLLSGPRPLHDLQFTTVAPALRKLGSLLTAEQLTGLRDRVQQGKPPAAEARRFLMSQRWI
jgi:hypothetical protein